MNDGTIDWLGVEAHNASDMEITLKALADYANMTRENKLNVMGIFRRIIAQKLPYSHPQLFLVLMWEASAAEFGTEKMIRIVLLDDDGTTMLSLENKVVIPKGDWCVDTQGGRLMNDGTIEMIRIVLLDDDGTTMLSLENKVVIPKDTIHGTKASGVSILGLNGLKFSKVGSYAFSILVNGAEKTQIPLEVVSAPPKQEGAA